MQASRIHQILTRSNISLFNLLSTRTRCSRRAFWNFFIKESSGSRTFGTFKDLVSTHNFFVTLGPICSILALSGGGTEALLAVKVFIMECRITQFFVKSFYPEIICRNLSYTRIRLLLIQIRFVTKEV